MLTFYFLWLAEIEFKKQSQHRLTENKLRWRRKQYNAHQQNDMPLHAQSTCYLTLTNFGTYLISRKFRLYFASKNQFHSF